MVPGLMPWRASSWRTPSITSEPGRSGVDSTLRVWSSLVFSLKAQRSVKVPPMSTPTRYVIQYAPRRREARGDRPKKLAGGRDHDKGRSRAGTPRRQCEPGDPLLFDLRRASQGAWRGRGDQDHARRHLSPRAGDGGLDQAV